MARSKRTPVVIVAGVALVSFVVVGAALFAFWKHSEARSPGHTLERSYSNGYSMGTSASGFLAGLAAGVATSGRLNFSQAPFRSARARNWRSGGADVIGDITDMDEVAEAAAAEWEEAVAAAAVFGAPPGGPARGEPRGTPYALPRVALMFLTRGPMPHETTWRAFLGTIPPGMASNLVDPGSNLPRPVTGWEALFGLYVHAVPGWVYPMDSLFAGRQIHDAEEVQWGQWSLVKAERKLLQAALREPANARFVMLSEACVPLYPAAVVYAQLMGERKSRIDACAQFNNPIWDERRSVGRWVPEMESEQLKVEHWRKSSQWVALTREHAELAAGPGVIHDAFEKYCWANTDKRAPGDIRYCIGDEHFFPTLLAAMGLEHETDCLGYNTAAWWDGQMPHPRTFAAGDIEASLISGLRMDTNTSNPRCVASAALTSAPRAVFSPLAVAISRAITGRAATGGVTHTAAAGQPGGASPAALAAAAKVEAKLGLPAISGTGGATASNLDAGGAAGLGTLGPRGPGGAAAALGGGVASGLGASGLGLGAFPGARLAAMAGVDGDAAMLDRLEGAQAALGALRARLSSRIAARQAARGLGGRKRRLEDVAPPPADAADESIDAIEERSAPPPVPGFAANATHPFLAATLPLYTPLGSSACSLFARKFQPEAAQAYAATVAGWSAPGAAVAAVRRRALRERKAAPGATGATSLQSGGTGAAAVGRGYVDLRGGGAGDAGPGLVQHGDRLSAEWQWAAEPAEDDWAMVALDALQQS